MTPIIPQIFQVWWGQQELNIYFGLYNSLIPFCAELSVAGLLFPIKLHLARMTLKFHAVAVFVIANL
jgi:hypothetical protein